MTILFIGKRFYTNRDALKERFGRIYQLPENWVRNGVKVNLWLVDYHTRDTVCGRPDAGLKVVSTPVFSLAAIRQFMGAFVDKGERPQVVIASGDCYLGTLACFLAWLLRARFVFDVYDKYDEFPGYVRPMGFDLFAFLTRRADACLYASRSLMGHGARRELLVPNGVDPDRFGGKELGRCRQAAGLPEPIAIIGYFGSMEPDRGVDDLILAVQKLRAEGLNIELLLGGRRRANLMLDVSGVRYLGNVPFANMPGILACCDLLCVPYRRSAFMDAGASNKIAESIACGRPLVVTGTPNFLSNFPDQAAKLEGLIATPGDAEDIARVIRLQLERRVLVDLPPGMDWGSISASVAAALSLPTK